jgi:hypothetical protein
LIRILGDRTRALALCVVLALVAGACTRAGSGGTNAQPQDLFAAEPSVSDVRSLLGDSAWWPGPPSFAVRPLDSASMPVAQRFVITQRFVHIGTAETFDVEFALYSTTTAASTQMTNIQNAFGTSASGPKVGDSVLYYGSQLSGGAPYVTETIVRVGQIVVDIGWARRDGYPKVADMGKNAIKVVARVKDLVAGKVHGNALALNDAALLPAPGLEMTMLGSARIPVEAALVMLDLPALEAIAQFVHSAGVNDIIFADYALNNDTHMEVRASVFQFQAAKDAAAWLDILRGTNPLDPNGVASFYDAAHGVYLFMLAAGTQVGLLICRSTSAVEAASRSCEGPLSRVTPAWRLNLGG